MKNSWTKADFQARTKLVAGLNKLSREAAGAVEIVVVRPPDALSIFEACAAGSGRAYWLACVLEDARRSITTAPASRPVLCACCPRQIRDCGGASFVVANAHRDDPSAAVTVLVCDECATEPADIERKSLPAFQKIWPTLRKLSVSTQEGRA